MYPEAAHYLSMVLLGELDRFPLAVSKGLRDLTRYPNQVSILASTSALDFRTFTLVTWGSKDEFVVMIYELACSGFAVIRAIKDALSRKAFINNAGLLIGPARSLHQTLSYVVPLAIIKPAIQICGRARFITDSRACAE